MVVDGDVDVFVGAVGFYLGVFAYVCADADFVDGVYVEFDVDVSVYVGVDIDVGVCIISVVGSDADFDAAAGFLVV